MRLLIFIVSSSDTLKKGMSIRRGGYKVSGTNTNTRFVKIDRTNSLKGLKLYYLSLSSYHIFVLVVSIWVFEVFSWTLSLSFLFSRIFYLPTPVNHIRILVLRSPCILTSPNKIMCVKVYINSHKFEV